MPVWQRPWFASNHFDFSLEVLTADSDDVIDWDSLKLPTQPSSMDAEAWDLLWSKYRCTGWSDLGRLCGNA